MAREIFFEASTLDMASSHSQCIYWSLFNCTRAV